MKLNLQFTTVVHNLNKNEILSDFFNTLSPQRWKIFKMLIIKEENDNAIDFQISDADFERFIQRNNNVNIKIIEETNDLMLGSYVMINLNGEFYSNEGRQIKRSSKILEVGIDKALQQISYNYEKFILRKGLCY